jgi:hypothetical protein
MRTKNLCSGEEKNPCPCRKFDDGGPINSCAEWYLNLGVSEQKYVYIFHSCCLKIRLSVDCTQSSVVTSARVYVSSLLVKLCLICADHSGRTV